MTKERKLLEISCKETLMDIVKESSIINNKLSFYQKTMMYDMIKEMSYDDVLSLLFNDGKKITTEQKREFESDAKKVAKYGAAGWAGRKVGMRVIGKRPITVAGKTILKGPKGSGRIMSIATGQRKFGALGTKGGIRGAAAAVAALFLYRKLTDPCVRNNLGNKKAQIACRMEGIKKVIGLMKADMGKCTGAADPEQCKAKLSKELVKWQTRYQELLSQYHQK